MASRAIDIDGITVCTLADSADGAWYQQRKAYEEKASLLYPLLGNEGFERFVDIGANSGFISMLARRAMPDVDLVSVEADPRLCALLREGFEKNALAMPELVNAVVGMEDAASTGFSLNPNGTLDNRVNMPQWEQVSVPMRSIDTLLFGRPAARTFYKIDTQGYELNVLRGMEASLANGDWLLKMEFAPAWLVSQGTDPLDVLDYLQDRHVFAEYAERIPFGTAGTAALFAHPIRRGDHETFLAYVTSLNRAGRGWVDLIVRPRTTDLT